MLNNSIYERQMKEERKRERTNYLMHAGVPGMKWGYTYGTKNGGRIADPNLSVIQNIGAVARYGNDAVAATSQNSNVPESQQYKKVAKSRETVGDVANNLKDAAQMTGANVKYQIGKTAARTKEALIPTINKAKYAGGKIAEFGNKVAGAAKNVVDTFKDDTAGDGKYSSKATRAIVDTFKDDNAGDGKYSSKATKAITNFFKDDTAGDGKYSSNATRAVGKIAGRAYEASIPTINKMKYAAGKVADTVKDKVSSIKIKDIKNTVNKAKNKLASLFGKK